VLIYLHGFNSSPASHKSQVLARAMAERGLGASYACPALPHLPEHAIAAIDAAMTRAQDRPITLVGSSLGGFYATWLAEKHDLKAVLINPAVYPHRDLRVFLGAQQNLYTGEQYQLTKAHLSQWASLFAPNIAPSRYLLLVETGDELLDYREAVKKYAGARQVVVQGGDHTLQSFSEHLSLILEFAGLATAASGPVA
jgi:predicted esterase YcpF (UPF0227 family)